jgi:nondiscriminating glutamyl-tRNA synthetase
MNQKTIRVRFAPSPTGMMHLGNVRTALMNYLFAKQKNGTFIIRIEDTDAERNFDPQATQILADLEWLGLHHGEGAQKGGPYEPYFQSQRTAIYSEKLQELIAKNLVYRCFCSQEELEKKRQRQLALKQPPRYDRACLKLSAQEIESRLANNTPFIWRFELNHDKPQTVTDIAHGTISFDMKSFSDIPLTRQDGSFTFMFANFVDDMVMKITHVIRGEDHLSNTAGQTALYAAFNIPTPVFWHLPIICNALGKKLSKRDFGFSLNDLRNAGFLPEAIDNYLAIIGGSFEKEIMSLEELATTLNFEHINPTSQIKYDVEKLKWVNHKWLSTYSADKLAKLCMPFLAPVYPAITSLPAVTVEKLLTIVKTDIQTLADTVKAVEFYFKTPTINKEELEVLAPKEQLSAIKTAVQNALPHLATPDVFMQQVKTTCQAQGVATKALFTAVRYALIGSPTGPSIHDILTILDGDEARRRFEALIHI